MRAVLLITLLALMVAGCIETNDNIINLKKQPKKVELFGKNIVSTPLFERDIAISQAGDEIIYTLGDYTHENRFLVTIKRTENGWSKRKLLPFSGKYQDIEPYLSFDGEKLYFASTRPMPGEEEESDYNIWVVERQKNKWGNPVPLDTIINTEANEFYPALGKSGNLYFTGTRKNGIGKEDIFVSNLINGKYQKPEPLDTAINTHGYEYNAWINFDENLIIFGAYGRKDGFGGGDLYFSKKQEDGNWSIAKNMGPDINSSSLDFCPFIDYPRGNFYFTSRKTPEAPKKFESVEQLVNRTNSVLNDMGNIYRINLQKNRALAVLIFRR